MLESNLASPWNRGLGQFGIGLFVRNIPGKDYKLSSCRAVFDYSGCIYAKKEVNLNAELKLTRRILDGKWTVVNLVRVIASIHGRKFNCFHIRASLLASNRGRRFRRPFNFPSNRQLFNEIIAYQELFSMVTLLASWNNQDDGEGNEKLKKKHATVLTDKQKKTWTCSAHFEKNSPCHCRWSNVVKLYRKGNTIFAATFKASSTRIWIIFNPQIFLSGFKNFHVYTNPYSNRICPSTRIHSQLIGKAIFGSCKNVIANLLQ